ncbi:hypothetical protein GDO78_011810 [Eleutherodactylus coqui]|uniref:PDZ domain-containing protein n=1 Tax=Eleutherodactylus coqui TaxID=57060 RepID=A0A8J6F156_ELECQ|nr:hypothetical protein GDO78_011810 [Eleutherodactylus coqui]
MSLYPSLEDLKVDKVIQAQTAFMRNHVTPAVLLEASASSPTSLEDKIQKNMSVVPSAGMQVPRPSAVNNMVAPLVQANAPASLAGLMFGDQVLQIKGENCAGWSSEKPHKFLKQAAGDKISMVIRDRPFERTTTMHKDNSGHVGFIFKNSKITSIVMDSSAKKNGLITYIMARMPME